MREKLLFFLCTASAHIQPSFNEIKITTEKQIIENNEEGIKRVNKKRERERRFYFQHNFICEDIVD